MTGFRTRPTHTLVHTIYSLQAIISLYLPISKAVFMILSSHPSWEEAMRNLGLEEGTQLYVDIGFKVLSVVFVAVYVLYVPILCVQLINKSIPVGTLENPDVRFDDDGNEVPYDDAMYQEDIETDPDQKHNPYRFLFQGYERSHRHYKVQIMGIKLLLVMVVVLAAPVSVELLQKHYDDGTLQADGALYPPPVVEDGGWTNDDSSSSEDEDDFAYCQSYRNCDPSYIGDENCDSNCFNAECGYDGGDCGRSGDCDTDNCRLSAIGDGNCDYGCNNAECGYDDGDCDRRNRKLEDDLANGNPANITDFERLKDESESRNFIQTCITAAVVLVYTVMSWVYEPFISHHSDNMEKSARATQFFSLLFGVLALKEASLDGVLGAAMWVVQAVNGMCMTYYFVIGSGKFVAWNKNRTSVFTYSKDIGALVKGGSLGAAGEGFTLVMERRHR